MYGPRTMINDFALTSPKRQKPTLLRVLPTSLRVFVWLIPVLTDKFVAKYLYFTSGVHDIRWLPTSTQTPSPPPTNPESSFFLATPTQSFFRGH